MLADEQSYVEGLFQHPQAITLIETSNRKDEADIGQQAFRLESRCPARTGKSGQIRKSSRHHRIFGFIIAGHSPPGVLEVGLFTAAPEKNRRTEALRVEQSVLYSPVCLGIIEEYGHYSQISAPERAEFLCTIDCVAERNEFEPSVQV